MMFKGSIACAALLCTTAVQARTQADIDAACAASAAYPGNNLDAVQASNIRRFWLSNSLPSTCQNAVYNAAINWSNSAVNSKFNWSGYSANDAYTVGAGDTITMTSYNTGDTWAQGGSFEDPYVWAVTVHMYYGRNSVANPPEVWKDADVIVNAARISQFYCGTGTTPSTLRDMTSTALHEFGHTWGLGHDECDKSTDANKAVMWWQGFKGVTGETRTLRDRDVKRGQFIYGAK